VSSECDDAIAHMRFTNHIFQTPVALTSAPASTATNVMVDNNGGFACGANGGQNGFAWGDARACEAASRRPQRAEALLTTAHTRRRLGASPLAHDRRSDLLDSGFPGRRMPFLVATNPCRVRCGSAGVETPRGPKSWPSSSYTWGRRHTAAEKAEVPAAPSVWRRVPLAERCSGGRAAVPGVCTCCCTCTTGRPSCTPMS